MTPMAIIVIAIAAGVVITAAIAFGRSIKIDTKLIKAELGRNGGSSAMDQLHKRLTAQDEKLAEHTDKLNDLTDLTYAATHRIDELEKTALKLVGDIDELPHDAA